MQVIIWQQGHGLSGGGDIEVWGSDLSVSNFLKKSILVFLLCGPFFLMNTTAWAGDALRVGIAESAPYTIKGPDGSWDGITVEVWRSVANQLGVKFEYINYELHDDLEQAVQNRDVDIALSDFAISRRHQELFDYSRTYFHSDLLIAGHAVKGSIVDKVIAAIVSPTVLWVLATLFVLVMFGAIVFWVLEKHNNDLLYDKRHGKGNFSNGIMWAILLITAQEPDIFKNNTFLGRLVAMFLLFIGVTVSASYIALITSTLTVHKFKVSVHGKDDLPYIRVAALHDSRASEYLKDQHLRFSKYEHFENMMMALDRDEVDAVVADEAKIHYYIRNKTQKRISFLPVHLSAEYFTFVFPKGSDLPALINPAISDFVENPLWPDIVRRYIGSGDQDH